MDTRPKFIQRRHTENQQAHEKMLHITINQRNVNQNHNLVSLTCVRMATIKESTNNKCWRRCGQKDTPPTLLVGI